MILHSKGRGMDVVGHSTSKLEEKEKEKEKEKEFFTEEEFKI